MTLPELPDDIAGALIGREHEPAIANLLARGEAVSDYAAREAWAAVDAMHDGREPTIPTAMNSYLAKLRRALGLPQP